MHTPIIRAAEPRDTEPIVALSLRAWRPVHESFESVWGHELFIRFYPDWKASQESDVRAALDDDPTWVVTVDHVVAGFVNVKFGDDTRMGQIYMIATDPDHQRQGYATMLIEHAMAEMRARGMTLAIIATGGDPGHAPARRAYERTGFVPFPQVLYSQLL